MTLNNVDMFATSFLQPSMMKFAWKWLLLSDIFYYLFIYYLYFFIDTICRIQMLSFYVFKVSLLIYCFYF